MRTRHELVFFGFGSFGVEGAGRGEGGGVSEPALHNHAPNVATTSCPACLHEGGLSIQRGQRGFSDEDAWSFNTYLAGVIAGGLTVLRDNLHGCPPELCEDDDVDIGVKRWEEILTEMIGGFQKYRDDDDLLPTPEFKRSLDLLVKWWGHLWD